MFSTTQAIFSRNVYTRNFIKLRRLCLGQGRAIRRADALLRHMNVKRLDPAVAPCSMLDICRNVLRHCKL